MHARWCAAGYDPDAFWGQTPRSFQSAMDGALERLRSEAERDIAMAHTTATFTRAEKLQRLSHYLKRRAKPGGKTSMLSRLKDIATRTVRA